jgi:ABC-type uncharacterized transport system substrate-binding protein
MPPRRVLILNSYSLTPRPAIEHVRIRSFIEGLELGGFRSGHDVEIEIIDSNRLEELDRGTREATARGLDLIHAVGTPNAIVAAHASRGIPIVYYGAHPEGAGEAACREAGVVGMVLTLPFTQSYRRFRFIRSLVPNLRRVWVPFYEGTVFCRPEMNKRHRAHRDRNPGSPWIEGTSDFIGYRSLAGLCFIIDVEYREMVYRDLADLRAGLAELDPDGALLMPYNDNVYCEGAPKTLIDFGVERGVPLLWNNNPEATQLGALAAVAGCFREAGLETGKMSANLLKGVAPEKIMLMTSTKTFASLNASRARALGIDVPAKVRAEFDEILEQ